MNYSAFKLKIFNDIKKEFPTSSLKDDEIIISIHNIEISLSIKEIYQEYESVNNYEYIKEFYMDNISKSINQYNFKLNYDNILPIIKSKSFGRSEKYEFLREDLFLDLDLLYVADMGSTFRFISTDDKFDYDILKEKAFNNLSKMTNVLSRLDEDFEIYSFKFTSDLCPSLLLSYKIREQIYKKVGRNFIFAIPSSTSILVATDNQFNYDVLKHLIQVDPDPHKVSTNIYRYSSNEYSFVIDKKVLEVVK